MKNVIQTLLRDLYLRIPKKILIEAFKPMQQNNPRTLDALIKEHIIVDIVLAQCNLYAGRTKKIVIESAYLKDVDDYTMHASYGGGYGVYAIPPEARENRAIIAVLDIGYPTTLAVHGAFPNMSSTGRSVANGIDEALSSFTHAPAYVTPTPILIDGNAGIIQLSPPTSMHIDWVLSCMLEYDKEFSNISLNMINSLKKMVEYATKAYIYNTLYLEINQGYLQGGVQLEAIRTIVESYADSIEHLEEALLKFRGASVLSPDIIKEMMALMLGS